MKKNPFQNEKCGKNSPTYNGTMLASNFYKMLMPGAFIGQTYSITRLNAENMLFKSLQIKQ